ncbi:MAG: hypothetical protein ACXABY_34145 [Candidatus Thorarchaeota archaeon]|jgi:hypothetical protein
MKVIGGCIAALWFWALYAAMVHDYWTMPVWEGFTTILLIITVAFVWKESD